VPCGRLAAPCYFSALHRKSQHSPARYSKYPQKYALQIKEDNTMQKLQIGRVYRHFKGDYYLVEGLAHDSESGVPCVIYRKLYGDGGLWVRPLEMFLSRVDREKYPEVRQEYRFQLQEIASVAHHGE